MNNFEEDELIRNIIIRRLPMGLRHAFNHQPQHQPQHPHQPQQPHHPRQHPRHQGA